MQIAGGFSSKLKATFEEFLGKWTYVEGHTFVCLNGVKNSTSVRWPILSAEKYLEIVGVYAISLLGMSLNDIDLAVSWTEKAKLPEERRQVWCRLPYYILELFSVACQSSFYAQSFLFSL